MPAATAFWPNDWPLRSLSLFRGHQLRSFSGPLWRLSGHCIFRSKLQNVHHRRAGGSRARNPRSVLNLEGFYAIRRFGPGIGHTRVGSPRPVYPFSKSISRKALADRKKSERTESRSSTSFNASPGSRSFPARCSSLSANISLMSRICSSALN